METGTYYLRARYYDPRVGRFKTADSYLGNMADPLSINLYTYCVNNPIKYRDPSGHTPQDEKDIKSLNEALAAATARGNKADIATIS